MILPIPTYNVVVDGPNRPAVAIKVAAHNYPHFLVMDTPASSERVRGDP